jgi:pimeloyl-ACP methyl ester carboxylesterase
MHWKHMYGPIVLISVLSPLQSQQSDAWRDPSPHTIQFVQVDKDVHLEVLDWGGSGRPVILLAGGGDTAHIFDEFAPKLTANCRVYGITRRGFGTSTYSPLDNGGDRLGEDVLAVIRALRLNKPVLVGHSIAGAELSSVATLHPNSIAGVVYLEAAYPYAFDNGKGPTMKDFLQIQGPQPPTPSELDLASFSALQRWDAQVYGFQLPESEFRQTWDSISEGRVTKQRDFPGSQMFMIVMTSSKKYANVPVPALAIFAIPHVPETWMTKSADPAIHNAADTYFARLDLLAEKQAKVFEDGVPGARVIRVRGMHYIFLSNESDVLREMRSFLSNLK